MSRKLKAEMQKVALYKFLVILAEHEDYYI